MTKPTRESVQSGKKLCIVLRKEGTFPVTSCFRHHSSIGKLKSQLCWIARHLVLKFLKEYRVRELPTISDTEWTSIEEDNMELNNDQYVLVPFRSQWNVAATSLEWELYNGARPKPLVKEKSVCSMVSTVRTLQWYLCGLATVPHNHFIEKYQVLVSDSHSTVSGRCGQQVLSMGVAQKALFVDEHLDIPTEPSLDPFSTSTTKPSWGRGAGRGANLLKNHQQCLANVSPTLPRQKCLICLSSNDFRKQQFVQSVMYPPWDIRYPCPQNVQVMGRCNISWCDAMWSGENNHLATTVPQRNSNCQQVLLEIMIILTMMDLLHCCKALTNNNVKDVRINPRINNIHIDPCIDDICIKPKINNIQQDDCGPQWVRNLTRMIQQVTSLLRREQNIWDMIQNPCLGKKESDNTEKWCYVNRSYAGFKGTFKWRKEQERLRLWVARRVQATELMIVTTIQGLPPDWRDLSKNSEVKIMKITSKVTTIWMAGPRSAARDIPVYLWDERGDDHQLKGHQRILTMLSPVRIILEETVKVFLLCLAILV